MKKFLTTLLCVVMVMAMMPMTTGVAYAENEHKSDWSRLQDAIATITNGENDLFTVSETNEMRTITLLKNITASDSDCSLKVSKVSDKNIVLDLNGHTLDRGLLKDDGSFSTHTDDGSVIYVDGTLYLTDSSSDSNGKITGGTGKNVYDCFYGGGIYVDEGGKLCISGGNIVGNYSENGAGISLAGDSTFVMTGGKIINNYSSDCDGAVSKRQIACLAKGTLITMADGSKKLIEELSCGETVRTFDHETGQISESRVDVWKYPEKKSNILCLHFSNNIDVRVASGHCFFNKSANKYVAINTDNAYKYIGHYFYNADNDSWEELKSVTFESEPDDAFIISTENHLNCVANGMLSNEDGIYTILANIFEFGDNLMIDQTKKERDISKWGLWDYSESQYIPKETYDALDLQYISIALGKGMLTKAQLEYVERETANPYYESAPFEKAALGFSLMLLSNQATPSMSNLSAGIYLGGNAVICDNHSATVREGKLEATTNNRNLYLEAGEQIYFGDEENGIALPVTDTNRMRVGITLSSYTDSTPFTTITNADYSNCFFSDNANYYIASLTNYQLVIKEKEKPTPTYHGGYFDYEAYKQAQKQAKDNEIKALVASAKVVCRTENQARGIKVFVYDNEELAKAKSEGYTVLYDFYNVKAKKAPKNSDYKITKIVNKDEPWYLNTAVKKGNKYYYKVVAKVLDAEGNVVATTDLTQGKYGYRTR